MNRRNLKIGYHASHEQFAPSTLVAYAQLAEAAGFDIIMSSDHLNPWSALQGHSGFNWAWLVAAIGATHSIPFGTMCIPGGWRYHPVIAAQAIATIAELYPGRLHWLAAGSGQALNEQVVSKDWPEKQVRNERTKKGVEMMRSLWKGNTITSTENVPHYAHHAKIWSLPEQVPEIIGAALSPETAAYIADWTDGLITVYTFEDKLKKIVNSYSEACGAKENMCIQVHVSWNSDIKKARRDSWLHWRNNLVPVWLGENTATVEEMESHGLHVTRQDVENSVVCFDDVSELKKIVMRLEGLGFSTIVLHNVGTNQRGFIEMCGKYLLPAFSNIQ